MKGEALGVHIRRKYEKLDECTYNSPGRVIQYATEEIAYSIGIGPTPFRRQLPKKPRS